MRAMFLVVVALVSVAPAGAGDKLAMRCSPAVSFAPANLVVRAFIEANADNRILEIVAESGDFYRSSVIQLDGDRAPHTNQFEFRSLPPGNYEIVATLVGSSGRTRAAVRQDINVISSNGR
jgi:hypothetical protein